MNDLPSASSPSQDSSLTAALKTPPPPSSNSALIPLHKRSQDSKPSERRKRLQAAMRERGGGIALIAAAPEVTRNADNNYPYRQNSDLLYLTNFLEPQAYLVLIAGKQDRAILFCQDKNEEQELWHGKRYGPEAAAKHLGLDEAYSVQRLDELLPEMLLDQPILFVTDQPYHDLQKRLQRALKKAKTQHRSGRHVPPRQDNVSAMIAEMRLIKDDSELDIMRRAAQISAAAHARAMRCVRPGLHEYEIEAALLYEFRRQGAQSVAYNSIVASGPNACILHYAAGDAKLVDGELLLIDAGCELNGYASDITRTLPINGQYSGPQRVLYDLVVAAQEAARCATRAGERWNAGHDAAVRVLAQGMIDVGLLKDKGTLDDVLAAQAYTRFYMHRTGHWLGLDVHDVGNYADPHAPGGPNRPSRLLEKGMVLTLEPGIYVRPAKDVPQEFWHIGIRIEDDAIVTEEGCELISRGVPVDAEQIEAWMRDASPLSHSPSCK